MTVSSKGMPLSRDIIGKVFPYSFLKVAVIGKGEYFKYYRDALVDAISRFGFEAKGFETLEYDYKPDVFLILNPIQFMNQKFYKQDFIYAGIQTEQISNDEVYCINMGMKNYEKIKSCLNKYDFIFEWSPAAYRYLKKKHENVYFFPHCNFPSMQYFNEYSEIEEKYDLFFTGWATGIYNRRADLLNILSERYNMYPKYEDLWGEEKEKAILSSRICLNIHFDNALVFESPRIYEYLANKRFVLTEKISDSYPFVDGQDFISFYIHNIIDKIDYYLLHHKERNQIANNGFNKINQYMIDDKINIILERFILEKGIRSNRRTLRTKILEKIGFSKI